MNLFKSVVFASMTIGCALLSLQAKAEPTLNLSCGQIQANPDGEVISDAPFGHRISLTGNKTYTVPVGLYSNYEGSPDGAIASGAYPNNGRTSAKITLGTDCKVLGSENGVSMDINTSGTAYSGDGNGTGASAVASPLWSLDFDLPKRGDPDKHWKAEITGQMAFHSPNGNCSVRINGSQQSIAANGPISNQFPDVPDGSNHIEVTCHGDRNVALPINGRTQIANFSDQMSFTVTFVSVDPHTEGTNP